MTKPLWTYPLTQWLRDSALPSAATLSRNQILLLFISSKIMKLFKMAPKGSFSSLLFQSPMKVFTNAGGKDRCGSLCGCRQRAGCQYSVSALWDLCTPQHRLEMNINVSYPCSESVVSLAFNLSVSRLVDGWTGLWYHNACVPPFSRLLRKTWVLFFQVAHKNKDRITLKQSAFGCRVVAHQVPKHQSELCSRPQDQPRGHTPHRSSSSKWSKRIYMHF